MSKHKKNPVKREPVLTGWAAVIVSAAALFGFDVDPELATALVAVLALAVATWQRSRVTPVE